MHGIGMDHPSTGTQNHQEMVSHDQSLETMLVCSKVQDNKKPRPADQQALKCPRCDSSNTKFCYYNNYSLTQPRYFCKSCRRYWTKGGTLRNVPVGGGCRKNKRSSSSSSSNISTSSSSSSKLCSPQDHQQPFIPTIHKNPVHLPYDSTDLSLAFARLQNGQLGFDHHDHDLQFPMLGTHRNNNSTHGFLDALRSGFLNESTPIAGYQNLYYGDNIGNVENVGGGSMNINVSEEMGNLPYEHLMSNGTTSGATTTAVTVTTVKQEGCNGTVRGGQAAEGGRVLWGYPWQIGGGDGGSIMGDVDAAGRQSGWINGLGDSNWHGLLNSPLM